LGLGDRLIGVSSYCAYPKEKVRMLPKVGDCINPNIEQILSMRPSVVLTGDMQTEAARKLENLGIPVMKFGQSRLEDVYSAFQALGARFGVKARADSIMLSLKGTLDSLGKTHSGKPLKRVLFVVGRNPGTLSNIYTVNRHSFLADLLHIAGGASVFDSMPIVWCNVSLEEILRRAPDYIIETELMGNGGEGTDAWKQMPHIPAVKNGRVYTLHEDYIFTPGPRMAETAKRLSEILGRN
jgi:iron complex transport system substrate-binding protein